MKKMVLSVVVAVSTFAAMWANEPKKMERMEQPAKAFQSSVDLQNEEHYVFVNNSKEETFALKTLKQDMSEALPLSEELKVPLKSVAGVKEARNILKAEAEQAPTAFYWKPEGTMFIGVDRTTYLMYYGGIVGSWLNGVDAWVFPNYSADAENVTYQSWMSNRLGADASDYFSMNEDGDWVDAYTPVLKGNPMYMNSWNMPRQIVSNTLGVDTFALSAYDVSDASFEAGMSLTVAGASYLYDDGMWPLTAAPMLDSRLGNLRGLLWSTTSSVQYVYGTEPITVEVSETQDTVLNVDGFLTLYEKPMSPLYVKDITLWVTSLGELQGDAYPYVEPAMTATDTLKLVIMDNSGNLLASSYATGDNLVYYEPGAEETTGLGCGMLQFPLIEEDEYGLVLSQGITLTDTFNIIVSGLSGLSCDMGIFAAATPYTGGVTYAIDDHGMLRKYANADPFMMLNGVYTTFEDAYPNLVFTDGSRPDPTVNELVIEPAEFTDGSVLNLAVYDSQSGNVAGSTPMINSSFYPVDTLNNNTPNIQFSAPDWLSWSYYDGYWEDLDAFDLYILADDLPAGTSGREGDVTISCYGKSITYHVTQGNPSGIAETKVNTTKLFSTADAFNFTYTDDFTSVDVYNVNGQKVSTYALPQTGTFSIAKAGLADGVYMFRMNGKTTEVLRAVK